MFWPKVLHIKGRSDEEIYLSRYWLLGNRESRWALMLHKMHRADDHACHHDHPWPFWTLILKGGYEEEITVYSEVLTQTFWQFNSPGQLLYREAEHTHRISGLPTGSCWTLVLRFRRERSWGFFTKLGGWIPWERFIANRQHIPAWCGEDE